MSATRWPGCGASARPRGRGIETGQRTKLRADGDVRNVGHVVVVEAVDVVHDARRVRLNGGEDEEVLQVAVVR